MKSAAPGKLPSFRPEVKAAARTAAGGRAYAASWPVQQLLPLAPPQTAASVSPTAAADADGAAAAAAAGVAGDGDCWPAASVTGACSASARRPA